MTQVRKTKQGDIREGLAWEIALENAAVAEGQTAWRDSTMKFWTYQADIVLKYLKSQGVVLKVKRELTGVQWSR